VSLKKVDHPNIVKILEIYKQDDQIYIVMEKAKGLDMLDYLFSVKTMTEFNAAKIIKQILKWIKHMNSLGLWHRDIKLENIMVDPDTLHVKLVDFGFSRFFREGELLSTQVGTPYYISPQILKGQYGKECDIWSLGILWFVVLTGFPPFKNNNLNDIYKTIISDGIEYENRIWKHKSKESLDFVKKWLWFDPEERLTPTQGLEHPWITQTEDEKSIIDEKLYRKYSLFLLALLYSK
jgi:calcium-dependent protein kinase